MSLLTMMQDVMTIVTTTITKTDWQTDQSTLKQLRETVFIVEQHVPQDDEWDDKDENAIHYIVRNNEIPIGCARVLVAVNSAKIGRVCIVQEHRGKGIATQLMRAIIADAKQQNLQIITLDAQTYILSLYEKLGFSAFGEEFLDAGIPHRKMQKNLD